MVVADRADVAEPSELDPRRWLALAALVLPVLLISIDNTILGFAVPHLSESLKPSGSQLLWIVDVYSFVLAGLLVTMGTLGDRIGRRKLLMIGAAGFSVASVLAAFAPNAGALIAARALLGVAGATLMPSTLSLIRNVFSDPKERQTAIAVWAAMFSVGSAFGPLVGGLLLDHFWWGSIFLLGVPFTLVLLLAAPRVIPESADPNPGRFDLPSAALSMLAMFPFVFGVKDVAEHGASLLGLAALVFGGVMAVLFVRRQRGLDDPMIDVSLFAVPRFRVVVTGNLVTCMGFAGSLFFVTQYLQLVSGMSALASAVQLMPTTVASIAAALCAPALSRRFGAFAVITGGLGVGAVGWLIFSQVDPVGGVVLPTLGLVVMLLGLPAAMTVAVDGILAAVPPERAGAGASISETANELGIALGTAVLGSIVVAVYRGSLNGVAGVPTEALHHARETLGAAEIAAAGLGSAGDALRAAAQHAFVDGVQVASLVAAALLASVAAWAIKVRRSA